MTKIFCDQCERDITKNKEYLLEITHSSQHAPVNGKLAMHPVILCELCFVATKTWFDNKEQWLKYNG